MTYLKVPAGTHLASILRTDPPLRFVFLFNVGSNSEEPYRMLQLAEQSQQNKQFCLDGQRPIMLLHSGHPLHLEDHFDLYPAAAAQPPWMPPYPPRLSPQHRADCRPQAAPPITNRSRNRSFDRHPRCHWTSASSGTSDHLFLQRGHHVLELVGLSRADSMDPAPLPPPRHLLFSSASQPLRFPSSSAPQASRTVTAARPRTSHCLTRRDSPP